LRHCFQLTPLPDDTWTENVLYSSTTMVQTVHAHRFGGLVFDAAGNLYGMTASGGTGTGCVKRPCGTVFQLHLGPTARDENVLHSFTNNGTDGYGPASGLIFKAAGCTARRKRAALTIGHCLPTSARTKTAHGRRPSCTASTIPARTVLTYRKPHLRRAGNCTAQQGAALIAAAPSSS